MVEKDEIVMPELKLLLLLSDIGPRLELLLLGMLMVHDLPLCWPIYVL